jgi:ATP-dependent RNA helicase RhlE
MNPTRNRHSRDGRSANRERGPRQSKSRRRGNVHHGHPRRHGNAAHHGLGSRNLGNRPRGRGRKMPTFNPSQFINTNPSNTAPEAHTSKHRFDTFGLNKQLVQTVTAMGFTVPTPIQDQIIPRVLAGRDVIGLAETGTGKTAAFLLPLIDITLRAHDRQTLILTPTRELALQIDGEFKELARGLQLFSTVCVGGVNIRPQIKSLRKKNHFVIGTPGRLLDLINRKEFDTSKVTNVVLDEADRMLDMGFVGDMRKILLNTPKERGTLLFSATMTAEAKKLENEFLNNPVTISVKRKEVIDTIMQDVVAYDHHNKFEVLLNLFTDPKFKRVLIFGAMKHSVRKIAEQLTKHGVGSESIHGNKNHTQRQRALTKFKKGETRVLVATDVAARGIHVDDITHVINYDLPSTREDYVHRIGRTGRATKRGIALTFVPTQSV